VRGVIFGDRLSICTVGWKLVGGGYISRQNVAKISELQNELVNTRDARILDTSG